MGRYIETLGPILGFSILGFFYFGLLFYFRLSYFVLFWAFLREACIYSRSQTLKHQDMFATCLPTHAQRLSFSDRRKKTLSVKIPIRTFSDIASPILPLHMEGNKKRKAEVYKFETKKAKEDSTEKHDVMACEPWDKTTPCPTCCQTLGKEGGKLLRFCIHQRFYGFAHDITKFLLKYPHHDVSVAPIPDSKITREDMDCWKVVHHCYTECNISKQCKSMTKEEEEEHSRMHNAQIMEDLWIEVDSLRQARGEPEEPYDPNAE